LKKNFSIDISVPTKYQQEKINQVIFDELVNNNVLEESQLFFDDLLAKIISPAI